MSHLCFQLHVADCEYLYSLNLLLIYACKQEKEMLLKMCESPNNRAGSVSLQLPCVAFCLIRKRAVFLDANLNFIRLWW